jgi:hypothetical protein
MHRTRPFVLRSSRPVLAVLLGALAALALACDSGTQEPAAPTPAAPESGAPTEADGEAPAAEAAPATGDIDPSRFTTDLAEGVTASIPDNFPAEVPIYPGSQPGIGRGVDIEGVATAGVQLLTNDAHADVQKFYVDHFTKEGWTLGGDAEAEAVGIIQATKGDCKASILVSPAESGGSDIYIVTEC